MAVITAPEPDPSALSPAAVQQRLDEYSPLILPAKVERHASVALILEPAANGEWSILFIERARSKDDPWSGQIAFPGGRREYEDADEAAVAERETEEEIGLAIRSCTRIGRLDDFEGRHGGTSEGMVISCFVYALEHIGTVVPNYEVASVTRLPASHLLDPGNYVTVFWSEREDLRFPGISFGANDSRIVWGLTYRFLRSFLLRLGYALPEEAYPDDAGYPLRRFG